MIQDNKASSHYIDVLISAGIFEPREEKSKTKTKRNAVMLLNFSDMMVWEVMISKDTPLKKTPTSF